MLKSKFIFSLILLQLILIVFLGINIFNKLLKKHVSISTINKNTINVLGTSSLKYFYEPKASTVETDKPYWLEKEAEYTYNKDALNERFDYQVKKPANTFRIVTLGDSFTQGSYVNTKDNWSELLEDRLNGLNCKGISKFEVINLGFHGYDIEYEVERFRTRGQKYDPDLLIWMLLYPTRINELTRPTYLECRKTNPTEDIDNRCIMSAEDQVEKKFGSNFIQDYLVRHFNEIFTFFDKKIMVIDLNKAHQDILKKITHKEKVSIFDLDFKDDKLKTLDGHPNQIGHQVISEEIFKYIEKNKLIICK